MRATFPYQFCHFLGCTEMTTEWYCAAHRAVADEQAAIQSTPRVNIYFDEYKFDDSAFFPGAESLSPITGQEINTQKHPVSSDAGNHKESQS